MLFKNTFLFTLILLLSQTIFAQIDTTKIPKNWHTLDLQTNGYFGVSLDKAYDLVKNKKTKTVIVAVIDSGIDTAQTDLQGILWVNQKEIAGNGKDDDKNGYVDDIHGWNFLGAKNGAQIITETSEEVRMYPIWEQKYAQAQNQKSNPKEFKKYLKLKALRDTTVNRAGRELQSLKPFSSGLLASSYFIYRDLKIDTAKGFTLTDIQDFNFKNDTTKRAKSFWVSILSRDPSANSVTVINEVKEYGEKLQRDVNPDLEIRKRIMGDNWEQNSNKFYGNNILKSNNASHGTAVAGLIGANRNNNYGIKGIANDVKIMALRAVPDGDEYDKDIANAIIYAVNNGAKIINMSFGKKISPQKKWVDAAFKYAAKKNVLLVQAAGNEGESLDSIAKFPNDIFEDGSSIDAANVINVGASSAKKDEHLAADFSNYSKTDVDIFAPGAQVTSISLNKEFLTANGTSFASPITAGVAALVLSYYPKLTAAQLKNVLLKSAVKADGLQVLKPGKAEEKVPFSGLSKTGGIVNAYEALKMASTLP
ncbi:MAG: peptidase S8 [Sphingobacteriales bacterium]|nr:MAG: peptidase S8 [Sphingobacteriales bacterium]